MSVLNINFAPGRIDLLSDTLCYSGGEPHSLCETKTHVAPSGRFAWTTRGYVSLGERFDEMAAGLADADGAILAARVFAETLADDAVGKGLEITVAGWSDRLGALAVQMVTKAPREPVQAETFTEGVHLLPRPATLPPMPSTVSEAQFIRLALAQWKVRDQFMGQLCIGGVMHLTTVTAAGADQRIVGLYPDHAQHAEAFSDPNAAAVAAFLAQQAAA
ncbi:hypothetical protein T8K17_18045 [Thalassobaculum sp. OXR-137]|uniref:hypothetical protein n=1 Tax=Thalassobaculum sp. OXR-137 TaxID=3100173 RepID=UPI002AC8E40D|nr:hypothetical protein [Thalassobaculum sp. OXR-137]WPZ33133.1 hypothetical protein T8K17_18045 [Thalassobaculum sp. OXR-137]